MNILYNLILFTFTMGSLIGPAPVSTGNQYTLDDGQYLTDDAGSQPLFVVEDTQLQERITKISNEINNMLDGKVSPTEVQDDIFDERFFAKERGKSMEGKELEENERFIDYLNSCDRVAEAYKIEDSELQSKIDEMNEKKGLI